MICDITIVCRLAALVALTAGCTQDIRFRVVDAATGQPLLGVEAGVVSSYASLGSTAYTYRSRAVPNTDEAGIAFITGLSIDWVHYISVHKNGYEDARVIVGGAGPHEAGIISPDVHGAAAELADVRRVFVVRLHPTTRPATRPVGDAPAHPVRLMVEK